MKALSIAVLALLGQVSAIKLRNAAEQEQQQTLEENRPDDTILLQVDSERRHSAVNEQAARLRANLGVKSKDPDVPYLYPKKEPAEWYELDNRDERIHGSVRFEESDDVSPHDHEVADAPEDMKRVGNDHEELHNAKLSPDGYYDGFFHKDFEGKYAQLKKKHSRHVRDNTMVQIKDHDNDSDDIPYSYESDGAHAIPKEGQSDYDLLQTHSQINAGDDKKEWGAYLQHQANVVLEDQQKMNDDMERVYAQEADAESYEFVQLKSTNKFDHDNDTQDIPDDPYYDPVDLHKKGDRRTQPFFDKQQYLVQQKEEKQQADFDEVQGLQQEQSKEDKKEMAELTKQDNERHLIEIQADMTQKEKDESEDVNLQISKFVGN